MAKPSKRPSELRGRVWSQAGDVLAAGRRAAQAGSHQINEQPLMAVIGGFALGYVADFLLHGRPVTADTVGDPKWREALKARRDPLCTG